MNAPKSFLISFYKRKTGTKMTIQIEKVRFSCSFHKLFVSTSDFIFGSFSYALTYVDLSILNYGTRMSFNILNKCIMLVQCKVSIK